jgi:hypothetical protein
MEDYSEKYTRQFGISLKHYHSIIFMANMTCKTHRRDSNLSFPYGIDLLLSYQQSKRSNLISEEESIHPNRANSSMVNNFHKRPQDRWTFGDNLNIPPHMWRKHQSPEGNSGGKGKKAFGIILGIFLVLVAIGLFT